MTEIPFLFIFVLNILRDGVRKNMFRKDVGDLKPTSYQLLYTFLRVRIPIVFNLLDRNIGKTYIHTFTQMGDPGRAFCELPATCFSIHP